MKAVLLFLLAATPSICVPVDIFYNKKYWCNAGIDGNGDCEKVKYRYTFCCIYEIHSRGVYVNGKFDPIIAAKNNEGETGCGAQVGTPPHFEAKRICAY